MQRRPCSPLCRQPTRPGYSWYGLVKTAWFYTLLYFGKRGRENQRAMKPGDLQLKTTTGGRTVSTSSWMKEQRRIILVVPTTTKMKLSLWWWHGLETPAVLWPVWRRIWRKENHNAMLCDRNPKTTRRVHSPLLTISGFAAYHKQHKLENLLMDMCKKAGLAQVYTPHCKRATSV